MLNELIQADEIQQHMENLRRLLYLEVSFLFFL